jgi:transcriptional regulator with XRE-family HTH domain
MKERILAFLQNENKSYAQFAEEIGVQPSGISHILSGRNNPSLDFVMKMLQKYHSLSEEWLLFGRGPMCKYVSLFDIPPSVNVSEEIVTDDTMIPPDLTSLTGSHEKASELNIQRNVDQGPKERTLTRVLLLYSDKTCTEYNPS